MTPKPKASSSRSQSFLGRLSSPSLAAAMSSGVLEAAPPDLLKAPVPAPAQAPAAGAQGASVVRVPLSLIQENPDNSRVFYDEQGLVALAEDLARNGQLEPAPAYSVGEGRYELAGGHRRFRAAKLAKLEGLDLLLRPAPANRRERIKLCRDLNLNRQDSTILDDAVLWRRYLEEGVFQEQLELATYLQVSPSYVSKALAVAALPPELLEAVQQHSAWLLPGKLYQLWQLLGDYGLDGENGLPRVLKLVQDNPEGLSSRDLDARRERLKAASAQPETRAKPDRVVFGGPKGKGFLKRFDTARRLELRLEGLDPTLLAKLNEEVGALVKKHLGA